MKRGDLVEHHVGWVRRVHYFLAEKFIGMLMRLAIWLGDPATIRKTAVGFLEAYDLLRAEGKTHNEASKRFGMKPDVVAGLLIARAYGPGVEVRDVGKKGGE